MSKPRVLIVDDSSVYRSQIRQTLETSGDFEVAGVAANGKIALEKMMQTEVHVVILDLEMPEMDGISTIKEMNARGLKQKVVLFSSQSIRGARITLEALSLGASDFVTKPVATNTNVAGSSLIGQQLIPILKNIFSMIHKTNHVQVDTPRTVPWKKQNVVQLLPQAIVIGSSTGGPTALETLFKLWTGPLRIPVFIVQHMPPVFTATFAERLSQLSGLDVREAKHGESIQAGRVYMAPGDYHMRIEKGTILLHQGPKRQSVRPACDELFESAAEAYGAGCMGVVLTGMGEDGKAGSICIKNVNGSVIIQNKESSAVYGMPAAVESVGAFDKIAGLEEIANILNQLTHYGRKNYAI